ncbi:DNA-directed RNA polymerases IV and V subunit 2-like [Impatiens glandulifera]|uniref:DNA-directed RNA polymerases IV and V subunit 2-like n=1 Tax=Impatiens glandulifera TaxID=253017 RepID=UPI001FB06A78|nr:DNA-directed RNA polymerases IV and V subunit 2-like [Impatiens glandulifera]
MNDLSKDLLENFFKKVSRSFFEQYGLISHQINSYNQFIDNGVQNVFDSIGEITVEPGYDPSKKGTGDWRYASVKFGKVTLDPPYFWTGEKSSDTIKEFSDLLPRHARLKNMTYSARLKVQVHVEIYTKRMVSSDKFKTGKEQHLENHIESKQVKEVIFGRIPVMVKSKLCKMSRAEKGDCDFDHGGYFIIKGAEKIFIAQEQQYLNRLWVSSDPVWTVAFREISKRRRVFIKLVKAPLIEHIKEGPIVLVVYFCGTEIPIWILFFALGVSSDKEVVELIDCNIEDKRISNILLKSIYEADRKCDGFRREGSALTYVDNQIKKVKFPPKEVMDEILNNYLFPNLHGLKQKSRFLGYMVKCLLQAYTGLRKVDNPDDFRNKRLVLSGELLEQELRVHVKHAERRMVKLMQRHLYEDSTFRSVDCYLDASVITNGINRAFTTGTWTHPYKRMERITGVVATLRRTNPLQTMSDMRKTRRPLLNTRVVDDARFPHPSYWGKLCFLSTPDGEKCGLVKNLAITGLVSTNMTEPLERMLYDCGLEKLILETSITLSGKYKVFLNGNWVGVCKDSVSFTENVRSRRRVNEALHQVEIKRDEKHGEVRIFTDAGRIIRPLMVVKNLRKIKDLQNMDQSFQYLLDNGIVELIGPEEEEDCQTALGIKYLFMEDKGIRCPSTYTHCELDASFLLSLSCALIPFANHDHARRVLYQSEKHSQQAIGFSTTNPNIRTDTNSHQLYYPQKPLFRTMLSDCLGKPGHPLSDNGIVSRPEFFNGQCAIVSINVHLGYNQEDSIVMNRTSLERGMFRSEHFRSYKTDIENRALAGKKPNSGDLVKFGKKESKVGSVDCLDNDGFPFIGANMQSGDIIIGKVAESGADHSIQLKHTEKGRVQKVVLSGNDERKSFATVSLRQVRTPCVGDKFSSMHGQKGVVGFLESQENLPFTIQGIVPDIIINPHAFPSRQTPGQILESALAKGIALGGQFRYATPFTTPDVDTIAEQLHRAGFSRWGGESVYDGRNGLKIKSLIFMGPTMYQRLVHMAEDKMKYRNEGPVHQVTRQPVSDRKRFGGIKLGEMERDCLIAHGASGNVHERLFTLSDPSEMHVCEKCTNMANVIELVANGKKRRGPYCRFCKSAESIVKVKVPYGAKLLSQELFAMGISLKYETERC